jgi:hypothetical protein
VVNILESYTNVEVNLNTLSILELGGVSVYVVALGVDAALLEGVDNQILVVKDVGNREIKIQREFASEINELTYRSVKNPLVVELGLVCVGVDDALNFINIACYGPDIRHLFVERISELYVIFS